jgi:phage gp45-like
MDAYTLALEQRMAALERYVQKLERRINAGIAFARSTLPANDSGTVQTIQGRLDALSVRDDMPVIMHYGFSSSMPVGGDKVVLFGNGERSNAVVVGSNHQAHRFTGLLTGECVLYDMWGHSIHMTAGGINIAGNVAITGNATVTGEVTAGFGTGDSVTLQKHQHGTGTAAAGTSVPTAGT